MSVLDDVIEAMARAASLATDGADAWERYDFHYRAEYREEIRAALLAAERMGWKLTPTGGEQRYTVTEIIDAIIAAGFTRVQDARKVDAAAPSVSNSASKAEEGERRPPYPNCRQPEVCSLKGYCPRDIACSE